MKKYNIRLNHSGTICSHGKMVDTEEVHVFSSLNYNNLQTSPTISNRVRGAYRDF